MYTTIAELEGLQVICYLGPNEKKAKLYAVAFGGSVETVFNLAELEILFSTQQSKTRVTALADNLSDAAQKVLSKLSEAGFNAKSVERFTATIRDEGEKAVERFTATIRDEGEKAVAEVRSLGIKSMATVGEGFIAVGDLLRKAAQK